MIRPAISRTPIRVASPNAPVVRPHHFLDRVAA